MQRKTAASAKLKPKLGRPDCHATGEWEPKGGKILKKLRARANLQPAQMV